ncbi:NADH:ubiquinone reductase (Na(+)-transporting) subunit F [Limimaricola hongkongensis]|uniref:Na(+)-translocating NADH-quinone reductase subunit F n=1 Tax=Limimaricola hongkongensis DSM 17492 TaxID=1122180 RepID=A0A017HG80_9RHOB|nr:NADH:ubiquinone reductase (Na(+)-transporting) subunit F [Limimaricola hongkongensis]EYD72804.1 Na(+)-translocating NADH-quinone reductase subunit F [Limimaricola hongkongensis DSM 17492]
MTGVLAGVVLLVTLVLALSTALLIARRRLVPDLPVAVTVNDRAPFESRFGTDLLGALAAQDILLPAACGGAGTCGQCRVRVRGEIVAPMPAERARLSRAERRQGMHLACQIRLRAPLTIELPEAILGARGFEGTVLRTRFLTPLIREIVLDAPPDVTASVKAGAFVSLTAPPHDLGFDAIEVPERFSEDWAELRALRAIVTAPVTRAYSIASTPADRRQGQLVLLIRLALPPPDRPRLPPGAVSSWLFHVKEGARIAASGPHGDFRAQQGTREMVLVGGGVGMAPLRAIIHERLDQGAPQPISFWYGARRRDDLFYAEEFTALTRHHPNFRFEVALSDPRPDDGWEGRTGFVHVALREGFLRDHPEPEACDYYLCGPPLMIAAVMGVLNEAGVPPGRIFFDDFGS